MKKSIVNSAVILGLIASTTCFAEQRMNSLPDPASKGGLLCNPDAINIASSQLIKVVLGKTGDTVNIPPNKNPDFPYSTVVFIPLIQDPSMAQPSRRVTLSIQNIQNGNPSEKLNGFFYNNLVNDKLTDPGIWNNQPLPETNENSYNIQTKDYVPAKNTIPAQCIYVNNSTRDVKTIEISGDWNSNSDQPTPQ